jgi:transcriptional/translational regulatory protein YebC/TACO1
LTLLGHDQDAGTAEFELHNPEAEPDNLVSEVIEQEAERVERSNERRDKLHFPEKPLPVDTSTEARETIHARLHEKLQIGDRVWTVTDIASEFVTLSPGHDHESHTLANELEDVEYTSGLKVAEDLNTIDTAL